MEQGGSFCARRVDRGTGHLLGIQLEYSAHRPAAVAQGARVLQTVSSASEPRELEPGSGHPAGQERNGAPEPVARMLELLLRALSNGRPLHVRFWPKADMGCCTAHVCFRG